MWRDIGGGRLRSWWSKEEQDPLPSHLRARTASHFPPPSPATVDSTFFFSNHLPSPDSRSDHVIWAWPIRFLPLGQQLVQGWASDPI